MATSSPFSPDVPGSDSRERLPTSFTAPSEDDEQLARAWARAGELAMALRETNEELALLRRRNRELEAELERARTGRGGAR